MKKYIFQSVEILLNLLVKSPFYPHWLEFRNTERANEKLVVYFKGRVLETGAGNGTRKKWILSRNNKVTEYIATDFSSWDEEFTKQKQLINKYGLITQALYGKAKETEEIDGICDALNLKYKDEIFDTYCSFEVLEHIKDPARFFSEAHRVLKRSGLCIVSMPFLYREHAESGGDFQRFTRWGFEELANKHGFKIKKIITSSYFGTTYASLVNQYLIRKILESRISIKSVLFFLCPIIFFTTNMFGYIIELLDSDIRFATRYHVVMQKKNE